MIVQSAEGYNTGGTNPPQFAAPPTPGNLLVVMRGGDTDTPEDGGWTDVFSGAFLRLDPTGNGFHLWQRTAEVGDTAIPPGTWVPGGDWFIVEISDLSSHVPLETSTADQQPSSDHPTLAISPSYSGGVFVLGGIIHSNTLDETNFAADAPFSWVHSRHVTGGSANVIGLQSLLDESNNGSYSVGASTVPFFGTWAAGAVAWPSGEAPPPTIHIDICDPDGVSCVRFERAYDKKVRVEYNGTGSGYLKVNRYDPQATSENLKKGNIVKVTFEEIDPDPIFEFILEEGDFTLVDSDEEGGEELAFGGRGTLAILAYSVLGHQWLDLTHPDLNEPDEGVWRWNSEEAAGIIRRLIDESQEHTPPALTMLTRDWSDTTDSEGQPFFDLDGEWEVKIGTDLLTAAMDLCAAGMIQLEMRPGFLLRAYDDQGSDRSGAFGAGVVRFEKGVNIATQLRRGMLGRNWASNVLIGTKDGYLWYPAPGTPPYVKEVFLDLTNMDGTNAQERAAARRLLRGEEETDAIIFAVSPTNKQGEANLEEDGFYYPGFEGTENGKYWIGDLVTLHTGDTPEDYQDATFRIHAITLSEDENGQLAPPIVELNAAYVMPDGSGGGAPGKSNENGGGGSSGPTNSPHVHTMYQPKVQKGQPDGYAGLDGDALVPSDQLGTGGEGAGAKFLTDAQTFVTPTPPVSDHGDLTGLGDDDHPQYALATIRWEPHVAYDGTVVLDGNGDPVMVEVAI